MHTSEQHLGDIDGFLADILTRVEKVGIDLADLAMLDHACYRTTSMEGYRKKQADLIEIAILAGETMVNGRPISTFRLNRPIRHGQWRVDGIELPAPKLGSDHQEGLEHVEFVVYDPLEVFMADYPELAFETRAIDRGINPELGLKLGEYSVKFHMLPLLTVVYQEGVLGLEEVNDGVTGMGKN